jgi:hypothetical protein
MEATMVTKWRVQIESPLGEVTHKSLFGVLMNAESYYETIYIPGSEKRLEIRDAGTARFRILKRESMVIGSDECPSVSTGGTPCRSELGHYGAHVGSTVSGGSVWWFDLVGVYAMSTPRFRFYFADRYVEGPVRGCGGFVTALSQLHAAQDRALAGDAMFLYEPMIGHVAVYPGFDYKGDGEPVYVDLRRVVRIESNGFSRRVAPLA